MSAGAGQKTCTKCGETKALDAFAKRSSNQADGRQARCKACNAEYRATNREHIAGCNAEYRTTNRERLKEYRAANRERIAERKAEHYAANREHYAGYQAEHRATNREYYAQYHAEYRATNRERIAEYSSEYRKANPDVVAANAALRRARKASVPHEPYSRSAIFAAYGGTCAYCDAPAEHLDHVVPISRGGADAPHNLLPACAPCNLSKGAKSLAEWVAAT